MTVPQRHPGQYGLKTAGGAQVVLVLLAIYGVFQFGRWLNVGEWLPANPFTWFALQPPVTWTGWHTTLAVVALVVIVTQMFALAQLVERHLLYLEHVDRKAKLMGRGKELTLKYVQAKNASAKYSASGPVGLRLGIAVASGKEMWLDWRSTILAIMNPGAGKTSCLAIPWILKAPGWVYATANKPDLYLAIRRPRERHGQFWCFDPQKVADVEPLWFWNPLTYIYGPGDECQADADTKATIQANLFADAARVMDAKTDGFFEPAGINLLSGLLLAAAVDKRPITDVVYWINNPAQGAVPVGILRRAGWNLSASDLDFSFHLNDETKRGVFANAKKVVNFLFNRQALAWIVKDGDTDNRPEFDPHRFVRSYSDTLISLSEEGVGSLGPLIAALTVAVAEAARAYAKTLPGGRIDPTGLLILDEVANVARIKMLPDWFSHFASQGLVILVILQSLAQGRAAWGPDGIKKMTGAATHRIYGRGIDEIELLEALSKLCGSYDERTWSTGNSAPSLLSGGHASRSTNSQFHRVPILEPADIAALPEWRVLVQYGGGRPVLGKIIPYFRDKEMDAAVKESIAEYGPRLPVSV